jgi:CubicO group peptidase (beta-lactamase class C family)
MKKYLNSLLIVIISLIASFILLSSGLTFTQELNDVGHLRDLSKYIENKMEQWKIPGMAIGVIQNDSVIFLKGFGFRDIDKKLPVTPQTIFGIASISKTFTAAAVGILYDEGKLGWNEAIIDYLPDFRLYDEYATFHSTVRDLLSHRTGLSPFSDLMVYVWPYERHEIYRRLRYLKPSLSFREWYQYSNVSFVTTGTIVGKLSGGTWEDFVEKRIFKPLRMDRSNFDLQIKNVEDFSYPYKYENGHYVKLPFRDRPASNPSGGINSSAGEMVNWLKLHLNKGQFDNLQIISSTSCYVIQNPHVLTYYTDEKHWAPVIFSALGWDFQPYLGHQLLTKGGIIDGFSGYISYMPQEKIGIIILANNREAYELTQYLSYYIYDRLLNLKEFQWDKIIENEKPKYREASEKSGKPQTKPEKIPYPLEKYTGSYKHDAYGKAVVSVENGEMQLNFNQSFVWPLDHCFDNVFKTEFSGATIRVDFNQDTAGNVISLEIEIEGTDFHVVFNKISDVK